MVLIYTRCCCPHPCSTSTMDICESPPQRAPDTTDYAANKNSIQSFRRSCDRCHIQKLKCPRSTRSPAQCQRCERAGHKCVYSRRNPRQTTRGKGSASSIASSATQEETIQSHQPLMATGYDISLDMPSLGWLSTLDGGDVDPLPDWSWQGFTESPLGGFHDLDDPTLYNPQTTSTSSSAEEEPATTACPYQDIFERLSSISKTLEDHVHFLANQWHHKDIQNCKRPPFPLSMHDLAMSNSLEIIDPVGKVFGTFQNFLATLQVQTPRGKPTVLEGCQQTRAILLASHCYTVCIKIMEALAENLCQEMSVQASQNAVWQLPGGNISGNGLAADFLVGESFSQLNPLASSLVSACTTLHTGVGILCKIEVELGVPQGNGIIAREISTASTAVSENVLLQSRGRKDLTGFTQAARFLGVMWEGVSSGSGYITILQNFQRHHAEILRLTRQHTFLFSSQILSPQTSRT